MKKTRYITMVIAGVLVASTLAGEFDPWKYDGTFHKIISKADRIVIRDGGLDCCGPVDRQKGLAEIRDTKEVQDFSRHIAFVTNQVYNLGAAYCGYPGIDWYQGSNRLALTAFHTHIGLKWKGFRGVAEMTKESRVWLTRWLLNRNIRGPHNEVEPEEKPASQTPENTASNLADP